MMTRKNAYQPHEDAVILDGYAEGRANGKPVRKIFEELSEVLDNRTPHALEMRYYNLTKSNAFKKPLYEKPLYHFGFSVEEKEKPVPVPVPKSNQLLQSLTEIIEENSSLKTVNTRLQARIKELEEDQAAFLKLMDKARNIGRQEENL